MPANPNDYYYNQSGYYDTATGYYIGKTLYYPEPKSTYNEVFDGDGLTEYTLASPAKDDASFSLVVLPGGALSAGAVSWIRKDDETEAADAWQYEVEKNVAGLITKIIPRTVFDYGNKFIIHYTPTVAQSFKETI